MSVNKIILVGNLGKDPQVRVSQGGLSICNFTMATTDRRKDASGNWADHTEWHNIVCFGKVAENCGKYLSKGRQVYIDGRIQTRKWQDKEGKDRWTTEIIANEVQFLGSKGASNSSSVSTETYDSQGSSSGDFGGSSSVLSSLPTADSLQSSASKEVSFDDDDIPF